MNVIFQPNDQILLLLGHNSYFKNQKYRLNKYCFIHDYMDVKLIYNHMTRAFISITNEELEKIYDNPNIDYVKFLRDSWFLVQEDFNEKEVTDKLKEHFRITIDDNYLTEIYDFVILPTTTCNARCFYCYEKNMSKKPMSLETAEKVASYIMKKGEKKERPIRLRWFGGEPLFNMKVIRHICTRLRSEGYEYKSSMISNGYLFDEAIVKEAITDWHLDEIQITLDGTEEVYNKAKNYIYKNQDEVSPFKKVIENIKTLTSQNVGVAIRMNTDQYNADDLKDLIKFIDKEFTDKTNLNLYCYPIFEDEESTRTDEDRNKIAQILTEIDDLLNECGFFQGSGLGNGLRATHCMVDNNNTININPEGNLGLCEHYIDTDFWSTIDDDLNGVRNWDVIKSWRNYITDDEQCVECPIYPSCIRTKKCQDLKDCFVYHKDMRIRHHIMSLEKEYNEYLKRENCQECNSNNCNIGNNDICACISQKCEGEVNWCYCIDKEKYEKANNQNSCYCISQDEKNNWCYCIDKEKHNECNNGSCTCKKEESKSEEVIEVNNNKSFLEKLKDLFR
jgi:sulfatase maturation enzyme AslB (radical SAM superfamily)